MKLSEHFTLEEFIRSDYATRNGINNTPSEEIIENLKNLCTVTLEPLRDIVKRPIQILSGYRCPELNTGIGGASNSQHLEGKAADIVVPQMSVDELFEIASKYVDYDQAIHEFSRWVHISSALPQRRMKLFAIKEDGKTVYKNAIA
jgi:uncharacterized protein YcbK (DUF882 family)